MRHRTHSEPVPNRCVRIPVQVHGYDTCSAVSDISTGSLDASSFTICMEVMMNSDPTVTIIMPAYNAERYLAQTLESVLRQTFVDFEVIVVDDGSADRTAEVAQQFVQRDARVRLIRQPNQRVSVARNTAMAAARGRFFALLDSDDLWQPEYLAEQLRVLNEHPDADIISANAVNLGGPLDGSLWKTERPGIHPIYLLTMIHVEGSVSIFSVFRRRV